jgi:lysozyme family protein
MADFKLAIPVIMRSEGGLSKNPNDSASKWPVPDGSGYHTNKGITWLTFSSNARRLGYEATPKLFYDMPQHIWERITKQLYWDVIKGDQIRSQSVATMLVDWYFGSGDWAVKNLQSVLNTHHGYKLAVDGDLGPLTLKAVNSVDAKKLTDNLQAARLAFIDRISKNRNNSVFRNGWIDDAKHTYNVALQYLPSVGFGLFALGTLFFWALNS